MDKKIKIVVLLRIDSDGLLSIPENSEINGELNLSGNKALKRLPNGLSVTSLRLAGSGIDSLPEQLNVQRYLDITDTGITNIPNGVCVGEAIFFSLKRGSMHRKYSYRPSNGCVSPVNIELNRT